LLDVGCGSGVCDRRRPARLLAGHRGRRDPAAVDATLRNADANGATVDVRLLDPHDGRAPEADFAVANITAALVEGVLARTDSRVVVASGFLERDEPELGGYRRRERRVRGGWAADLLERSQ
jgi:ribosomal protein L11 methylase PrmA